MKCKLKSEKEVLLKILKDIFKEELKKGDIVPSDTITYVLKDDDYLNKIFEKWLIKKGYAE